MYSRSSNWYCVLNLKVAECVFVWMQVLACLWDLQMLHHSCVFSNVGQWGVAWKTPGHTRHYVLESLNLCSVYKVLLIPNNYKLMLKDYERQRNGELL